MNFIKFLSVAFIALFVGQQTFSAYTPFKAASVQRFLTTGTTTGYVFTVTSANATVGATYTNNAHTFTVLATISSGTLLFSSGASAPLSSGTLTKATGTGDATITFSAGAALGSYVVPNKPAPIQLKVYISGGGGGGACGKSTNGAIAGDPGTTSYFGSSLIIAPGGGGGTSGGGAPGASGTAIVNSPAIQVFPALTTSSGQYGGNNAVSDTGQVYVNGPSGGANSLGGGGLGGLNGGNGGNGVANTGAGGGGGGSDIGASYYAGSSGGPGAYTVAIVPNPVGGSTYYYRVGLGGNGYNNGGANGGNGAVGVLAVEADFQ